MMDDARSAFDACEALGFATAAVKFSNGIFVLMLKAVRSKTVPPAGLRLVSTFAAGERASNGKMLNVIELCFQQPHITDMRIQANNVGDIPSFLAMQKWLCNRNIDDFDTIVADAKRSVHLKSASSFEYCLVKVMCPSASPLRLEERFRHKI